MEKWILSTVGSLGLLLSACAGEGADVIDVEWGAIRANPTPDLPSGDDPAASPSRPPPAAPSPDPAADPAANAGSKVDNGAAPPPTTVLDQRYADLAPQGTILFYDSGPGRIAVEIPVVNIGNAPLPLDAGEIRFNFLLYQGSVYPSALGPGQQGWFEFFIPTTLNTEAGTIPSIAQCEPNDVVIDHGHTMQLHSNPDDGSVYSNDHLFLQSQCLTWTKPITMDFRLRYGLPEGASLQDIVSSKVQGSSLGFCSHCHHSDRQDPANPHQPQQYFPLIHHDTDTYTVTSGATIGGRSWNGRSGSRVSWASRFTSSAFKQSVSPAMMDVFRQWIANGSPN